MGEDKEGCHQTSKMMAKSATTFPHLAKPGDTILRKDEKAMVQIKRDWFDTALENYEREKTYGRWKEKIQV